MFCFFLFNITTTTDIYTLSLHDALPILVESMYAFRANDVVGKIAPRPLLLLHPANDTVTPTEQSVDLFALAGQPRSEEHTSELQSRQYLVCRLLLEKKKKNQHQHSTLQK